MSPAKTAEPVKMPFVLWAGMVPRNHVLDGGPQALTDVAIATNFCLFVYWLSVGYNFGCMIASDMLFDSRGGFLGSSHPMRT